MHKLVAFSTTEYTRQNGFALWFFTPSVADSGLWAFSLGKSEMAFTDQERSSAPSIADLYRSHSEWLRALVWRRGGRERAEDIVQEAFERLVGLGDPPVLSHPKAFLSKVATNLLRDSIRRDAAVKRTAPENIFLETCQSGSTEQFETVLLEQVVLSLPASLREVFLLSRFVGLSHEEIARVCGISAKTVEWRIGRALALCTVKLRE
jgi:RNA polymerase sigma-70 factor (ECF subfamily)